MRYPTRTHLARRWRLMPVLHLPDTSRHFPCNGSYDAIAIPSSSRMLMGCYDKKFIQFLVDNPSIFDYSMQIY
jgi:hypothetical protein